jgi:hypothetical protein
MVASLHEDQNSGTLAAPSPDRPRTEGADLHQEEIRDRLRLVNPELTKELYELAKAQVAAETARHARLDAKATSLVSSAGVSLTLGMSIATLIAKGEVSPPAWLGAMLAFVGAVGVTAVGFGVFALMVKGGFARVNDHNVFDTDVLKFANAPTGCDDLTDLKDKYAFGAAAYRQHMTAHLWEVSVKEHYQLNKKARQVRDGQIAFFIFLAGLVVCVGIEVVVTSPQHDAGAPAKATAAAPKGAVR